MLRWGDTCRESEVDGVGAEGEGHLRQDRHQHIRRRRVRGDVSNHHRHQAGHQVHLPHNGTGHQVRPLYKGQVNKLTCPVLGQVTTHQVHLPHNGTGHQITLLYKGQVNKFSPAL
jgi:hypothetical protein